VDLVGSSSCSVVASHVGRGESDGARRQHRWSLVGALVVFGIMALAIVAARGPIVGLLAADDATAALARAAMLPAAAALVALVVETICLNTLIAAGDVRVASAIETGSGWVLFVPACVVVVGMANGGPVGVWVVEAVTGAVAAGILVLRIHGSLRGTAPGATLGLAPQRP
jgi:Na+-driven multidrug efflux pump